LRPAFVKNKILAKCSHHLFTFVLPQVNGKVLGTDAYEMTDTTLRIMKAHLGNVNEVVIEVLVDPGMCPKHHLSCQNSWLQKS
jgi:hypothetical protein